MRLTPNAGFVRIAVTALSLTACVLLVSLWVRSCGRMEKLLWTYQSPNAIRIIWADGQIQAETATDRPIQITSTASGTFDWHESTFVSAPMPDADRLSFDFALYSLDPGKTVSIRLLVLIAATFAALPWLRWRFSLRTLFIATTLVALGLGLIVLL
jgi:hypothetical protein